MTTDVHGGILYVYGKLTRTGFAVIEKKLRIERGPSGNGRRKCPGKSQGLSRSQATTYDPPEPPFSPPHARSRSLL